MPTEFRRCPECSAQADADAEECPNCGTDVSEVAIETLSGGSLREYTHRLPGIDEDNSTRRNVLVGGAYAFLGIGILGAAAGQDEDEGGGGGNGDEDGNGNGDTDGNGNGGDGSDPTPTQTQTTPDEPAFSTSSELLRLTELDTWDPPYMDDERTTLTGSGQTVTDDFDLLGEMAAFIYDHDGDSNFIVEVYDATTDERLDILINQIGTVSGAVAVPAGEGTYYLDVDADGPWEIVAAQPVSFQEDVRTPPASASGTGPDVVGPIVVEGATVTGSHTGESNFIVEAIPELAVSSFETEIVFNEIGRVSDAETRIAIEGWVWFDIQADGSWELRVEE